MDAKLKFLAGVMSLIVLAAYVGAFGWAVFGEARENEALAYIWTGVSVLVGGVVAVAFGQEPSSEKTAIGLSRDDIVVAYAWTYVVVGMVAIGCWIYLPAPPDLVKNAATTFFGLLLPIVSAYLGRKTRRS
jgi:hypothetical protein